MAIGRIDGRVLIATYHHHTAGAAASKVFFVFARLSIAIHGSTKVLMAPLRIICRSLHGFAPPSCRTLMWVTRFIFGTVSVSRAESAGQRQGSLAAERQRAECRRRCQLPYANRQEVHVYRSPCHAPTAPTLFLTHTNMYTQDSKHPSPYM